MKEEEQKQEQEQEKKVEKKPTKKAIDIIAGRDCLMKMSAYPFDSKKNGSTIRYRINRNIGILKSIHEDYIKEANIRKKEILTKNKIENLKTNTPAFSEFQKSLDDLGDEEEEIPTNLRTFNDSEDENKTDIPAIIPGDLLRPLMGWIIIDIDEIKDKK